MKYIEGKFKMIMRLLRNIRYKYHLLSLKDLPDPAYQLLFEVKAGYRHRFENDSFDATGSTEGWQKEVYESAAMEARKIGAEVVFDVGCGSAFKLMKHFSELKTVGFEVKSSVDFLKKTYPDRDWRESNFASVVNDSCEILICADVIEHIPNPDELLNFLSRIKFDMLFLSTPERDLLYGFDHSGPPNNPAHCREWTMSELRMYVSRWFDIVEHSISNVEQATQMIVCRPKARIA